MLRLIPRPLHRAALRVAHRIRHRWRLWRGTELVGVSAVLHNEAGELLLVRHSYASRNWSFPGGGLKRGETPEQAIRREIREELGCALAEVRELGRIAETISGSPHRSHVFAAIVREAPRPDRREIAEAAFFAPGSLPEPLGALTRDRLRLWRERGEAGG